MKRIILSFTLALLVVGLGACSTVKPYQRVYLNDSEMEMGVQPVATFNQNVYVYREGASGGGTEKGSGGCGCN